MSLPSEDDDSLLSGDVNEEPGMSDSEGDIDYYAMLNVPREATDEEITRAYKARCLVFHPDRHVDEENRREAAKIFVQLKKAYETLSDPHLRSIYDLLGARGLEMEGWSLVQRSTNPENIRREYEFLERLRETELMMARVRPATSFAVNASLAGLFLENPEERYLPQLIGMSLLQSMDCAMAYNTKFSLKGRVKAVNGRGDGSFIVACKRIISSTLHVQMESVVGSSAHYFQASTSIGADSISCSTRLSKTLSEKVVLIVEPSLQCFHLQGIIDPSILTLQLRPSWHGSIALNYGLRNTSLTTSVVHTELGSPKASVNLTLSPMNSFIRMMYNKRSAQSEGNFEGAITLSEYGMTPSISFDRKLSRYSRVGATLSLSYPTCLLRAKFRLKTSLSSYELNLVLCDSPEDIARSMIYGLILPYTCVSVAKWVFRGPLERLARLFSDKLEDEQINEARKEESQRVVHLMRETAERIAAEEERKHGLVIVEGIYGQMESSVPGAEQYPMPAQEHVIDVTIPLQSLVNDSQLRIFSAAKDQLPGFYDPCPGHAKMLKVVYRFRDTLHSRIESKDDKQGVVLLQIYFFFSSREKYDDAQLIQRCSNDFKP